MHSAGRRCFFASRSNVRSCSESAVPCPSQPIPRNFRHSVPHLPSGRRLEPPTTDTPVSSTGILLASMQSTEKRPVRTSSESHLGTERPIGRCPCARNRRRNGLNEFIEISSRNVRRFSDSFGFYPSVEVKTSSSGTCCRPRRLLRATQRREPSQPASARLLDGFHLRRALCKSSFQDSHKESVRLRKRE